MVTQLFGDLETNGRQVGDLRAGFGGDEEEEGLFWEVGGLKKDEIRFRKVTSVGDTQTGISAFSTHLGELVVDVFSECFGCFLIVDGGRDDG